MCSVGKEEENIINDVCLPSEHKNSSFDKGRKSGYPLKEEGTLANEICLWDFHLLCLNQYF